MKKQKILRLLGMIVVLSMLMAVIPATPVMGANDVSLAVSQGKIGDSVIITGANFAASTESNEKLARIIFSNQSVVVGANLDTDVVTYADLGSPQIGFVDEGDEGEFDITVTVPSIMNSGATSGTVSPGTYYIYVVIITTSNPNATYISVKKTFTVTASSILNAAVPASGTAGTSVTVSGSGFLASYPVIISFDTTVVSSTTVTDTAGAFTAVITVPATATAGVKNISVTVGTTIVTTPYTVTASPTLNALLPATGAPGTIVSVSGANLLVSYPIIFKFDTQQIQPTDGDISTTISGGFASRITIPSNATAGVHKIYVTVGTVVVNADFTVITPATTTTPPTTTPPTTTPTTTPPSGKAILSINQSGHTVGSTIGIGGAGFTPGATVTIKYDNTVISTTKVETNGTFISPFFKAPASVKGDHTITATDGINTATAKFTMESTMPKVPPPLKPELGAKVKSPVTYDWTDVIDDSMPVTYRLQVAADKTFGESTLVLDKTGIESSGYTMTELEELKLAGSDTPYYWRVKSIDAASNESDWTGAGLFYVPGPFKFPSWGIYVGAIVGALLFFLIGLLIGRRTAFYY